MLGKKHWESAVVADTSEIDRLSNYLSQKKTSRCFAKKPQPDLVVAPISGETRSQTPPFHYLKQDLNVLLGPSGTKLLTNTWSKFHLSPAERSPQRLRGALVKLFAVASRVAAPRGVGQALKRLVADFERLYFPIVENPQSENTHHKARRFALLTVLQNGQGDHLLNHLLGEKMPDKKRPSLPSRLIEDDHHVARRKFLFEQAYRAKSWSEAYQQARLLTGSSDPAARALLEGRYLQVCQALGKQHMSPAKKKQLLVDLAQLIKDDRERRLDFALKAVSAPIKNCRPGDIERLVCDLLSPTDPRWQLVWGRLYRHQPQSKQWMSDLRTLWQSEPALQPKLKLLLNLLRLPRVRVEKAMTQRDVSGRFRLIPSLSTFRVRLHKVREQVHRWQELVPPDEAPSGACGAVVNLSSDIWGFVSLVCSQLDIEAPVYARTNFQVQPVLVGSRQGKKYLSFAPEFFQYEPEEQKFLLARGLFRGAAGLDALEARLGGCSNPEALRNLAVAYCRWTGRHNALLEEDSVEEVSLPVLLVALEELYWESQDEAFVMLAEVAHRQCWCPLFESEADLFASSFVQVVTASHALIRTLADSHGAAKICGSYGMSALFDDRDRRSVLALRLQRLWVNYLFSTDQIDYQM